MGTRISGHATAVLALVMLVAAACDQATAGAPSLSPGPSGSGAVAAPGAIADAVTNRCDVSGAEQGAIVVEPVRQADGSCLAPRKAVLYRCDPSFDPVFALGIESLPHRFLGGAYAVPVATLPDDARAIGVSSFGGLFLSADQRRLYVEAGGLIERWLTLPDPNRIEQPPTAFMIGDSILDGAKDAVVSALPDWTVSIDALIGRGSGGGVAVAEAMPQPPPDVAVVELGVNDADPAVFAENQQRILAAVGSADLVVWVTAHGPELAVPGVNRAIFTAMGELPNGAVLDWDRLVPPEDLGSDGVHPVAGQEGLLASFLTPYLESWMLASTGRGATRCERDVAAALAG
ncbi:MAG TPA: hypothetical protein VK646_02995 [Actinomycetota bacterium]|nr:hypothetical protein [Actinomycetota bacterium]